MLGDVMVLQQGIGLKATRTLFGPELDWTLASLTWQWRRGRGRGGMGVVAWRAKTRTR